MYLIIGRYIVHLYTRNAIYSHVYAIYTQVIVVANCDNNAFKLFLNIECSKY